MKPITFITGNPKKAEYLEKYLRFPVEHEKINLDEIQSLDLREIVEHKVLQAYTKIQRAVLVEDVSLEFSGLGRLPGPFIKFFEQELGLDGLCRLLDGKNREAIARCTFGYYDGKKIEYFEGMIVGKIAFEPKGINGFGWDQIFIPYFSEKTTAELSPEEYERFYIEEKPFGKIREYLLTL